MRRFIDANSGAGGDNPIDVENFFKPQEPCFFEGCEELRQQMANDINRIGAGCTGCQKRGIDNKYREKIREILKKV